MCVSENRPHHLIKAIEYFKLQTYSDKEFVLVSRARNPDYDEIIRLPSFSNLTINYFTHESADEITLGDLRNLSIKSALGEYFCIWDDDDWHHCQRLEKQMDAILKDGKNGSILAYCILFDTTRNEAYLSHPLMPPATILCKKSIIDDSIKYPQLNLSEDLHFFRNLNRNNALKPIIYPALYIYNFHGANSWNVDHFNALFRASQKLSTETSSIIKAIVKNEYSMEKSCDILGSKHFLSQLDYFRWHEIDENL